MRRFATAWLLTALIAGAAHAGMKDDPLLLKGMIDELEWRDNGDDPVIWDAQLWIGKDLNKLWLKSEGERSDGDTEEAELQLLYSRAVAPFWDLQAGWRSDLEPGPERQWLAVGFQGLAPYLFEIDTTLFIGESGRTALRLEAEYELLFTQRLILAPEIEANLYGHNDVDTGAGSGLSDVEAGLRLRYEIVREFAPYIGINWEKRFGNSADFARAAGEDSSDSQWVIGIRAWF